MRYLAGSAIAAIAITVFILMFIVPTRAATSIIGITANGTVTGGWTVNGTADGTCTGHCEYVDETTSGSGDGNTSYLSATTNTQVEEYTMGDISQGQTMTSFKVYFYAECATNPLFGSGGYIHVVPKIQGASLAESTATIGTCGANTWQWYSYTYNGTWSQADINTLALNFTMDKNGGVGNPTMGLSATYVEVTAREPDLGQSTSRIYNNTDSSTPGTALAASGAQADVQKGASFRIRAGITVSDYDWQTGSWGASSPNTFKLQYAARSAGSCSAQASGWGDVQSGSGAIRWNDNPSVADNAAISSYGSDPSVTGTAVHQVYRESNPFSNSNPVTTGNTGLWDFSLKDFSSSYGTIYCFRIIESGGGLINSYTNFPSIITVGSLDIDIVDAGGISVSSPNMPFGTVLVTDACQQSSGTLGASSQVIRVTNNIATNGWSLSLAATNGPTALWTDGATGSYDYNDSGGSPNGCSDSGDSDSSAGRLTVSPALGTLVPQSGCSSAGTSLGSTANFAEGSVDSITLTTATSATPRFCYFSITDIGLTQQIPSWRSKGNYTLDFTLTVLSL